MSKKKTSIFLKKRYEGPIEYFFSFLKLLQTGVKNCGITSSNNRYTSETCSKSSQKSKIKLLQGFFKKIVSDV